MVTFSLPSPRVLLEGFKTIACDIPGLRKKSQITLRYYTGQKAMPNKNLQQTAAQFLKNAIFTYLQLHQYLASWALAVSCTNLQANINKFQLNYISLGKQKQ